MNDFKFKNNVLHVENVSINNLIKKFDTPFYCYSANTIIGKINEFKKYFDNSNIIICYAVKANPNIAILKILSKLGCGAEVVSIGELLRTLKAGISNNKIVFSGVGKTSEELEYAIKKNILQINVESLDELRLIIKISKKLKKKVNLGLRINPNIDAKTHSKITTGTKNDKFGLDIETAEKIYKNYNNNPNIKILGLSIHIGSQITNINRGGLRTARIDPSRQGSIDERKIRPNGPTRTRNGPKRSKKSKNGPKTRQTTRSYQL